MGVEIIVKPNLLIRFWKIRPLFFLSFNPLSPVYFCQKGGEKKSAARIFLQLAQRGGEDTGLASLATVNEIPAGVLDSTSSTPREHNGFRTDVFTTAVVCC